ncbi:MAG: radical SAM protein, partial [Deferribacteraceae bacterium]|nr:radical SAM protein [Deferribacteraceae bacterium]
QENFGVELKRLNLPIGLRDTDAFIETLIKAGGALTERLQRQRSRYLDAMADSHKYNSDARAAIFGEPDFVFSMCRLLSENGAFTALAATGSECKGFESAIQSEVEANKSYYLNEEPVIIDEADFSDIENLLKEKGVNLLVGSSDARRLEQTYHIPLVRAAFPVHDHVGGQRVRTLGYEGSLTLLDRITNSLLSATEHTYRAELYNSYYPAKLTKNTENPKASGSSLSAIHPCFNGCGSNYARLHLPVAKRCNLKCNYCLRKYDCPNESRPGITSRVLSPEEALDRYLTARDKVDNLTVVGIAGPGDALADFEKTKRTLTLIREIDENIVFCISTNGLFLPYYADELAKLRATHITVTVNAVEPAIGAKIYENVAFMGASYHGETGAALLMANQFAGISRLKELGIVCKVNTVVLKGINDEHIPAVAKKVRELGAELQNIMQLIPVKGSAFENTPLVSNMEILKLRKVCSAAIPQMNHCRQCRADALGTLDNDISRTFWWSEELEKEAAEDAFESHELLLFAVSSKGGVLVDQHFGHTEEFYIYEYNRSEVRFREKRSVYKYCGGKTDCDDQEDKINLILNALDGCKYLLCMRIGENPKRRLEQMGIQTFITYDRIESAVKEAVKTIGGVERKALCRVGDQK